MNKNELKEINASFGSDVKQIPVLVTGIPAVDELSGIGGLPLGKILMVHGVESSGKSTICMQVVASAQKQGIECVWIDSEASLDVEYAKALGIDLDTLVVMKPDFGEQAIEAIVTLVEKKRIIVLDSVPSLLPRKVLEGTAEDALMGRQALMYTRLYPRIILPMEKSGAMLILINQERVNFMSFGYGDKTILPGGKATRFYCSMRIECKRMTKIKRGDVVVGNDIQLKCAKNKVGAAHRVTEAALMYGVGLTVEKPKKK